MRVDTAAFDGLRGIGALQVSLGHFSGHFYYRIRIDFGGATAVVLFLIMSGALMAIAYGPQASETGFARTFWVRRAARIAPLYWASLLPFVPLVLLRPYPLDFNLLAPVIGTVGSTLLAFAAAATFTQTWLYHGMTEHRGINPPLWTLSAQVVGWALFPFLARWLSAPTSTWSLVRGLLRWWVLYVLLSVLAFVAGYHLGVWALPYCTREPLCSWDFGSAQPTDDASGRDWAIGVSYMFGHKTHWAKPPLFVMGMLVGWHATAASLATRPEGHDRRKAELACDALGLLVLSTQVVTLLGTFYPGLSGWIGRHAVGWTGLGEQLGPFTQLFGTRFLLDDILIAPVLALWLFCLTQSPRAWSTRLLSCAALRRLGDVSFGIYVLHYPVLEYYYWARCGIAWLGSPGGPANDVALWEVVPAFALILTLSALATEVIEKPGRKMMQAVFEGVGTSRLASAKDTAPKGQAATLLY